MKNIQKEMRFVFKGGLNKLKDKAKEKTGEKKEELKKTKDQKKDDLQKMKDEKIEEAQGLPDSAKETAMDKAKEKVCGSEDEEEK